MVGMNKEDVLACMGPPKQKAHVGETEVWSFASTDGSSHGYGNSYKYGANAFSYSARDKSFCTVNIVMKSDRVTAVRYNGPRGGLLDPDEQCGYAVEHCVEAP